MHNAQCTAASSNKLLVVELPALQNRKSKIEILKFSIYNFKNIHKQQFPHHP